MVVYQVTGDIQQIVDKAKDGDIIILYGIVNPFVVDSKHNILFTSLNSDQIIVGDIDTITIRNSSMIELRSLTVSSNNGRGIVLHDCDRTIITNCKVMHCKVHNLFTSYCTGTEIIGGSFLGTDEQHCIYISNGDAGLIIHGYLNSKVIISGAKLCGIQLNGDQINFPDKDLPGYGKILGNQNAFIEHVDISNCKIGVNLACAHNTRIENVKITDCENGFNMWNDYLKLVPLNPDGTINDIGTTNCKVKNMFITSNRGITISNTSHDFGIKDSIISALVGPCISITTDSLPGFKVDTSVVLNKAPKSSAYVLDNKPWDGITKGNVNA